MEKAEGRSKEYQKKKRVKKEKAERKPGRNIAASLTSKPGSSTETSGRPSSASGDRYFIRG